MKLDLLTRKWIDIVFEGRNKSYGAYQFRKDNPKTTMIALLIGALIFSAAIATPLIISLLPDNQSEEDLLLDQKIVTVKLPPKQKEKLPENAPPPPPPPPQQTQVKFVKPVVAKTEDVVEEPPKIEDTKDKKLGSENIKGDPDAPLRVEEEVGTGPVDQVVEAEDTQIYNSAGIEVKPDFPGGIDKFYKYIAKNYQAPDDENFPGGRVYVTFVVEKDGSLTDIKILRDAGFGTGKEALRVLSRSPRWSPGEQNGKR